jgi:hypothetical protein
MRYRYVSRESGGQVTIVRKAVRQSKSFVVLADELPTGDNRQVLLMVGRQGRDKVPLVLSDDSTVRHIVGSVMCRIQGQQLVGVVGFASDTQAQEVRDRYTAGKLAANLITNPIAGVELMRGESFHGVTGPAMVLTQWEPIQVVLDVA